MNELPQKVSYWWRRIQKNIVGHKPSGRAFRILIAVFFIVLAIFSYFTNPFVRFSLVVDPYQMVQLKDGEFVVEENDALLVKDDAFFRNIAYLKSGWHIFTTKISGGKKTSAKKVDEIIAEIHHKRFDPREPFLISGDHFTVLYPRSLGIFYHSLLDPRTALNEEDWENRQHIYLKTTAYALNVYDKSDRLSTTLVPVGPRSVALLNIYAPPSDTLYSLLYALQVMQDDTAIQKNYPFEVKLEGTLSARLATGPAARALQERHKAALERHWQKYFSDTFDPESGLVRKDILLSGTKDIVKRESAFYDNVILWRTHQMAQQLGIIPQDQKFLDEYKQRILQTYWLPEQGYFLEDLSEKGKSEKYYSSDWLVAYQTGFLSAENPEDLPYLEKSVATIQRNALDQPFALQYHADERKEQLYPVVRLVAPNYGATAIWSNWGMEYTKLLTHLAQVKNDEQYLIQANQQISAYAYNIKRYRGYPEVYDEHGDFFRQGFYKSIRQTGWVVSFEQARAMVDWTKQQFENTSGKKVPLTSNSLVQ